MSEENVVPVTKRKQVSNVDYVKAYKTSKSYAELAAKIGVTKESAASRASKLSTLGVVLTPYDRTAREVDVEALNALLRD